MRQAFWTAMGWVLVLVAITVILMLTKPGACR